MAVIERAKNSNDLVFLSFKKLVTHGINYFSLLLFFPHPHSYEYVNLDVVHCHKKKKESKKKVESEENKRISSEFSCEQ